MKQLLSTSAILVLEWASVVFWIFVLLFSFGLKLYRPRRLRKVLWVPGSLLKLILIFATVGILAGCSGADPLPVAHGPLFQLNTTNWQASPQDLSAPPKVANN
jgi:lysylphosphatidylglycerol synthetase-like protein (DUF2156 family)